MATFPFTHTRTDGKYSTYTAYRRDGSYWPVETNFEIYPSSGQAIYSGEKYAIVERIGAFLEFNEALRVRTLELIAVYQIPRKQGTWHKDLSASMVADALSSELIPYEEVADIVKIYNPRFAAKYELSDAFVTRLAEHGIPENHIRETCWLLSCSQFPVKKISDIMRQTSQVGFNIGDGIISLNDPFGFIDPKMGFWPKNEYTIHADDWIKLKSYMIQ